MQSKAKLSSLWADWQRRKREERTSEIPKHFESHKNMKIYPSPIFVKDSGTLEFIRRTLRDFQIYKVYTYIFSTHQSNLVTAADFSRRIYVREHQINKGQIYRALFTQYNRNGI